VETVPLGAGLVLRQFSWQTEVFLLKYLAAPVALGLFSGSYRFLIGLTIFSSVLTNPLFPMFVRLANESRELLAEAYRRALRWFVMLAFPAVAVCVAWPHTLVLLFLGKTFLPAAHLLPWLGLAIIPIILTALYPVLYSTLHETGRYLTAMGGMAVLRILLAGCLILDFGNRGACWSVVIAEAALFLVLAGGLRRLGLHLDRMRDVVRLLLPFGVMASALYLTRHQPVFEQLWIGPAVLLLYGVLLWRLKNFSVREVGLIREAAGFCRLYLEGLIAKRKAHA
jgi:O-antigen/teichoic acid export membrane protein